MASANIAGLLRDTVTGALVVSGAAATVRAESKRALWLPTGAIDESFIRPVTGNSGLSLTTGTLRLIGGMVVKAGETVSAVNFHTFGASTALTNSWGCLVRMSDLLVLGVSADGGAAAWASGLKQLALTTPWLAAADTAVYAGVVLVGTGLPTISGQTTSSDLTLRAPAVAGNSTTGLTTPASIGANAAALTAAAGAPYAYIS